jgi:hypothetical protein
MSALIMHYFPGYRLEHVRALSGADYHYLVEQVPRIRAFAALLEIQAVALAMGGGEEGKEQIKDLQRVVDALPRLRTTGALLSQLQAFAPGKAAT